MSDDDMTEDDFASAERALCEWFKSQDIKPIHAIVIMANVIRFCTWILEGDNEKAQRKLRKTAAEWIMEDNNG